MGGLAIARGSGAYKLAYQLRNYNYSAKVIDFVNPSTNKDDNIDVNVLEKLLKKYIDPNTYILGFSMTFWGEPDVDLLKTIISIARELNPKINILVGGAVTTYSHFQNLPIPITAIVSGYAENLIVELMNYYTGKGTEPEFSYPFISDIKVYEKTTCDHYNFTDCKFKHHPSDNIMPGEALSIELSRGCIFKCKFCDYQYLGKKKIDYMRNLEYVKEELEHNYYNYGTLSYTITDSTFNETDEKLKLFADMVEGLPFKPDFNAFMRPDLLSRYPAMIDNIERANFSGVFFGLETLGRKSSVLIGKGWNGTAQARYFLEKLAKRWHNKITIHTNMIVGLPHDTESNIFEYKNYLHDIGIPSWYFTPLYIRRDLRFATSEFDRNYHIYGFHFKDDKWYHEDGWSEDIAHDVSMRVNKETTPKRVVPFFWYAPFITSKTHTIDELINTHTESLQWDLFRQNQKKFLKNYFTTLLNEDSRLQ